MDTWFIILAAVMIIIAATLNAPTWTIITATIITLIATATTLIQHKKRGQ